MSRVRNVQGGTEKYTQIITVDKMDRKCHAYHRYEIHLPSTPGSRAAAAIRFQHGPVADVGANGCSDEDLLAIVADRLSCSLKGPSACRYKAEALAHLRVALSHLTEGASEQEKRVATAQRKA